MPKVSLDMPSELLNDLKNHVGDEKKFISVADAIRSACRKLLDHLDTIDKRQGRLEGECHDNTSRSRRSSRYTPQIFGI